MTPLLIGALAHVKWFTDPRLHPTQYGLLLSVPVVGAFLLALAAVGIAYLIQHRVPEPKVIRSLERYAKTGPLALRVALGVALIAASVANWLFVPSLVLDQHSIGLALRVVEAGCGLLFLAGLFTRYAALLLALLGLVAMFPFSVENILEQVHILGIAVYLFIAGPGPLSVDARREASSARSIEHRNAPAAAINLLRIAMGFGIAYGALTEKLLNPPLAQALLDQSPFLNILRPLGVGDPVFIWLAGATELVIGVVILSGQITRPVMAVGFGLFTITLIVFGLPEFIGHLPYYGIMLTLFIAPDADSWRVQRALRTAA